MPFYEYGCHDCRLKFQLQRPVTEYKEDGLCPECGKLTKKLMSNFSHHSTFAPDSGVKLKERHDDKKSEKMSWAKDYDRKNPDPLKSWRKEREQACDKGPEAWVEEANEKKAKEKKKETYGENWLGREV